MEDYGQNTLFGDKIISTISYNEQEIIRDILYLHADRRPVDLDPTYSIGNFYKKGVPKPKYKFDKYPEIAGVEQAESHNIPLDPGSCNVIMFDPPFVMSGENIDGSKDGTGIISKRFTSFKNFGDLKDMYGASLQEFYRLLAPEGIVIFKCQDVVVSGQNHMTHCWVMEKALSIGFYPKDLFILLAKVRISDGRKQKHARKYHSYFWVFKKTKCRVNYN